jgi:hypothetical protein
MGGGRKASGIAVKRSRRAEKKNGGGVSIPRREQGRRGAGACLGLQLCPELEKIHKTSVIHKNNVAGS